MNMSLMQSKWLPVATITMSIPLFLSYNIKYGVFPQGVPYVILFTWGLLSVIAVPILLLIECFVILRILKSAYIANKKSLLIVNAVAIIIASIAGLIFVVVRNGSPQ
jgi:hypothetical protein